jgi:DNA-binding NarL/FixJ family response regulator
MDQETCIAVDKIRPETSPFAPERESLGVGVHRTYRTGEEKLERHIAFVEARTFLRECMQRGMQAAFSLPVVTYSTFSELERNFNNSVALVLLSLTDARQVDCIAPLKTLSVLDPSVPIVVLANANDMDLARTAINFGAKGYIPFTTNFEIVVEAVRFILAGGTYIPMDYLLASGSANASATHASPLSNVLTDREISVVQAIQQGKSNKVIAYQLCICEGTVKVHLRNIMKKLKARNRTDVAIKAQSLLSVETDRPNDGIARNFR